MHLCCRNNGHCSTRNSFKYLPQTKKRVNRQSIESESKRWLTDNEVVFPFVSLNLGNYCLSTLLLTAFCFYIAGGQLSRLDGSVARHVVYQALECLPRRQPRLRAMHRVTHGCFYCITRTLMQRLPCTVAVFVKCSISRLRSLYSLRAFVLASFTSLKRKPLWKLTTLNFSLL